MLRSSRRAAAVARIAALAAVAPSAAAQEQEPALDAAPALAPAASPPELLEAVEAAYPEEARAQRLEARVLLRLSIDVEGRVTEAEVVEAAGHGFDEAAREAALRFRFVPARRGGAPVAARILFPYSFALPAEPAPEAVPQPLAAEVSPPDGSPLLAASEPAALPANAVDVKVAGARSEAQRLQQSAEAVNVIDTREARRETADLGEVLARTQGVAVRRNGGLGSSTRFSLNGLYDDQIRFFLDGVPLDGAGYPFGIANVPVNLVERVEVYRGVVPIRFGADALGGAVNLVSDQTYETGLAASYQVGSFGTYRVTLAGRHRHEPSGFVIGAAGAFDHANNDYDVDVEIPDQRGRLFPATVPRFHDAYRAQGATLELGFVEVPWADRLLLRAFASSYRKELQHNVVMTVPYGEVEYGESVVGATARYDVHLRPDLELGVVASYGYSTVDYEDMSEWVYDWNGRRIRERRVRGEIESRPRDQSVWQHATFGRALLAWSPNPEHTVRASVSPAFATRTGDERIQADPAARDPLSAERDLFTLVGGVEHELTLLGEDLSNIAFLKSYHYWTDSEEPLPGGIFRERDRSSHTFGIGDALRLRLAPWIYAKASYEYATRLPRPDEVFGDGVLIQANLGLQPEVSHNANIGPRIELEQSALGRITLDVNAFLRDSDRLIVLIGNDRFFSHENVYAARGVGVENAFEWVSPGDFVSIDGMLTWQDVRNASDQGTFGDFEGDRIPNRPYLFGSWGARLSLPGVPARRDRVEPFYHGRYVHGFFRGWESQGLRQFKQTIDAQVTHGAGVSWTVQRSLARVTSTLEVDNVTDARVFDNIGVQRPGRAFYVKVTGEM